MELVVGVWMHLGERVVAIDQNFLLVENLVEVVEAVGLP